MVSRIQLHRYTGGVVLSRGVEYCYTGIQGGVVLLRGAEYSYTGILGAWYSTGQ